MKRLLAYTRGTQLNQIVERAALISTINKQIQPHLAEECRPHVHVANYEAGLLSLIVDSPSWGTRLHFETPRLLSALRTAGLPALCNIKILQRPPAEALVIQQGIPAPAPASLGSINTMQQICLGIEHPELRSSLTRLATTLENLRS